MSKLIKKQHEMSELIDINRELIPLKELADRELASIYGLTGMVYTPHIDKYMKVSIIKAQILASLKEQQLLPLSDVEVITSSLNNLHSRSKNNAIVEHEGQHYKRRFLPLKLTKSGKNVQRWAKFWLLLYSDESVDPVWESEVKEIWPTYFLIRSIEL